jgi:hypothetical protein
MITLIIVGMGFAAIIGFIIGVVWQSDKGPDREDWE